MEEVSLLSLNNYILMKAIMKQVAGIDVAQKELVVCLGRLTGELQVELHAHKIFPNSPKGFCALVQWVERLTDASLPVRFVMEATGVYHEQLAYHLDTAGRQVSIVLPNKISNYLKTLEVKTITDRTASEAICRFGLERALESWQRPSRTYKNLRQLTREREQVVVERTQVKNQLHAEGAEAEPNKSSLARFEKRIALLDSQEREITAEIQALITTDEQVRFLVALLTSLPGVGTLTAATVLAETGGFELIRNKRQLTSYAGLDVREKQSGTSVKGTPRISKKGNRYLRKALYLPALSAIRSDARCNAFYTRLVQRHGIKMKAAVAVQRKLLELMFTLYKTTSAYDKHYLKEGASEGAAATEGVVAREN